MPERDLIGSLTSAVGGSVSTDVPLHEISRWRIGGPAALVVEPETPADVGNVLRLMAGRSEPVILIGETSNLLFDSQGLDGVLLRIGQRLAKFTIDGNVVRAGAGVLVGDLARAAGYAGLTGLEHAVGIPGTVGGLVLMNGGSQRRGIGDCVVSVGYISEAGEEIRLTKADMRFAYRSSALQSMKGAVVDVELELSNGDPTAIAAEIDRIIEERSSKFPLDLPNCGSTFLSNPAMYSTIGPPGRAIEQAGLKGVRIGGAQISEKHANFVVNVGGATDDDVLRLIALARNTVYQRTGHLMDCEVRHVSVDGTIRPAHTVAEERWGDLCQDEGIAFA